MKINYYAVLAIMLLLAACRKNDDMLFDGNVFGPSTNTSYEAISSGITLVKDKWVVGSDAAFPVKLTKAYEKDVNVSVAISPSLSRIYDSATRSATPTPILPEGAMEVLNNGIVTVKAGEISSRDSVKLAVKNASLLVEGVTYVVPLVISGTDVNVPVDQTKNLTFIKFTVGKSENGILTMDDGSIMANNLLKTRLTSPTTGNDVLYIKAVNRAAALTDQNVEVQVNSSLVSGYNTANETSYEVLPENSYTIQKAVATISRGATLSADNFAIKLINLNLFDPQKQYLLPVELKSVSGGGYDYPVNASQKVVYFLISTEVGNVNKLNPVVTGTETARTGWILNESSHFSNLDISMIKDGNYSTVWFTNYTAANPAWFTVDMGEVKTIKGFMFTPNYFYSSWNILGMTIQTSADGVNWTDEGKYAGTAVAGGTSAANPDKKYVSFYEPVASRYFKFIVTASTNTTYTGMGELYAYE